jgi:hypothetical protein
MAQGISDHVLFHGRAVNEAEALQELRGLMRAVIERGVRLEEFGATEAGFTADFLLQGLRGALVPIPRDNESDRYRSLVPAREILGG